MSSVYVRKMLSSAIFIRVIASITGSPTNYNSLRSESLLTAFCIWFYWRWQIQLFNYSNISIISIVTLPKWEQNNNFLMECECLACGLFNEAKCNEVNKYSIKSIVCVGKRYSVKHVCYYEAPLDFVRTSIALISFTI